MASPAQALASHAGRLSPLTLDRGRRLHVSEPFILHSSANCLSVSSVHFSAGLVFSTTGGGHVRGRAAALRPPHSCFTSFRPGVPAAQLKLLFQATSDLRVGLTPHETLLSSPEPRSQRHSMQPTHRPSVLEHSLCPASPTACSYFLAGHLSATSQPPPPLEVACFLPLPHTAATEAPTGFRRGHCLFITPPQLTTLAGVSLRICSIHAVAPATETKPRKIFFKFC